MKGDSSRWRWFLWGRVFSYALLGGLATAFMGAVSVALAGGFLGLILDWPIRPFTGTGPALPIGSMLGAVLGGGGGAIIGLLIFGLCGFFSPPHRRFLPPRPRVLAVLAGQVLATIAAVFAVLMWEFSGSFLFGTPFKSGLNRDIFFILFGGPAITICGGVAGAVWASRRAQLPQNSE